LFEKDLIQNLFLFSFPSCPGEEGAAAALVLGPDIAAEINSSLIWSNFPRNTFLGSFAATTVRRGSPGTRAFHAGGFGGFLVVRIFSHAGFFCEFLVVCIFAGGFGFFLVVCIFSHAGFFCGFLVVCIFERLPQPVMGGGCFECFRLLSCLLTWCWQIWFLVCPCSGVQFLPRPSCRKLRRERRVVRW